MILSDKEFEKELLQFIQTANGKKLEASHTAQNERIAELELALEESAKYPIFACPIAARVDYKCPKDAATNCVGETYKENSVNCKISFYTEQAKKQIKERE